VVNKWCKSFLVIVTVLFFPAVIISAELPNINISGYAQHGNGNDMVNKTKKIRHDATNKLRLELSGDDNDRISFGVNIISVDYYGLTTRRLWERVPDSVTAGLPAADSDIHVMDFEDQIYMNDMFITYDGDRFDFTAGKQQLVMGVGYAYNPLDVLNVKNIMDSAYEPSGHSGYRFDYSLGSHSSLMVFYGQKEKLKDTTKLVKLNNTFDSLTFSLLAGESLWTFTDYYSMIDDDVNRRFVGGDIKKNFAGFDLWAEVMYNWMEQSEDYEEAVMGVGKPFGDRVDIKVEYFRYGLAKTDCQDFDINDWFSYFYGQKKSMSRDIAVCAISLKVTDHFTFQPFISHSINDGSFKISPNAAFPVSEQLEFNLSSAISSTKQNKAYNVYGGTGFKVLCRYTF
jgi:hypothetical protein